MTTSPSPQDCNTWREEGVVDGAEGPGSLDELDELVVAALQPLQTVGPARAEWKVRGEP